MKNFFFTLIFFFSLFSSSQTVFAIGTRDECLAVKNPDAYCKDNCDIQNETEIGTCGPPSTAMGGAQSCCKPGKNPNQTVPTIPGDSEITPPPPTAAPPSNTSISASSPSSFDYTPLEKIPGQGETKGLSSYLTGLYNFGLGAVGIAALLMAIVGGYFYVTSAGNTSRVSKGKELITDAILGIVVAFCAWLLLYIINPDLVRVNLESLSTLQVLEGGDPEEGEITGTPPTNPNSPNQVPGGSCGGMRNQVGNQCKLASSALTSMLTCMKENGDTGIVTSVTASAVGDNLQKSQSGCSVKITHAKGSCHYGCPNQRTGFAGEPGLSHAIDYGPINSGMSDAQLCAVADRAHRCGSGQIWGPRTIQCPGGGSVRYWPNHGTHFHISTAACNH